MGGEPVFNLHAVGKRRRHGFDRALQPALGKAGFLGIGLEQSSKSVEDGGIAEISKAGAAACLGNNICRGNGCVYAHGFIPSQLAIAWDFGQAWSSQRGLDRIR